jgi:hypothetical protein
MVEHVKEPYFDKLQSDLIKFQDSHPDKKDNAEKLSQELREMRDKQKLSPEAIWHDVIALKRFPRILATIQNMTWSFQVSSNLSFLTGDNPVSYFIDIGLKHKRNELSFPISKHITLLAGWQRHKDCEFVSAKASVVREINRRTVVFALKYIFYHRSEEWIIKLLTFA